VFYYIINKSYGKHSVSTADGERTWNPPQACTFLTEISFAFLFKEKSTIIERTIQYIKDRTDDLTITFHVEKRNVN
jgi:hypothetical protein